jgi:hypothetical protein
LPPMVRAAGQARRQAQTNETTEGRTPGKA